MSLNTETAARVERWAKTLEPGLRDAVLKAFRSMQRTAPRAELLRLIESGDIAGAQAMLFDAPEARAALATIRNAYADGVLLTASKAARAINATASVRIIVQAPRVDSALLETVRAWQDNAFRNIVQDARDGLREQVARELARGVGPRQAASAIKGDVGRLGLTAYDEHILANARAELEQGRYGSFLRREFRNKQGDKGLASGKTLTAAQIDRRMQAMRTKQIGFRAQTLARTASIQAANDANQAAYDKAVTDGAIKLDELRRYWVVAGDERTCPRCLTIPALNPKGRGLYEPFATPLDGLIDGPVVHPRCRCVVAYRVERAGVRQRAAPGTERFVFV